MVLLIITSMIKSTVRSRCDHVLKNLEQSQANQFDFGIVKLCIAKYIKNTPNTDHIVMS